MLDWASFEDVAGTEWSGDVHCVTRWSKFGMRWQGAPVAELIARARPKPTATHLLAHSYGGYTTNLPLSDVLDHPALIAHRAEGEPLEADHGGPARLFVPHLYLWKSAKWVPRLELLDHDRARVLGAQRLSPPRRPVARRSATASTTTSPARRAAGSPGRSLSMAAGARAPSGSRAALVRRAASAAAAGGVVSGARTGGRAPAGRPLQPDVGHPAGRSPDAAVAGARAPTRGRARHRDRLDGDLAGAWRMPLAGSPASIRSAARAGPLPEARRPRRPLADRAGDRARLRRPARRPSRRPALHRQLT